MLVEDHDVGTQPLEPPVLLSLQDLADQRQVVLLHHPNEQDGEIPGDAVRPEAFLAELTPGQDLRARTQRAIGVQHARRQPLVEQSVLARDAEVPKRALRVGESEGEGPGRRARPVVLLGERQGRVARERHAGGERQPHEASGCYPDALAQADHGVEHDAGGAGERAPVEGLGILRRAPPAEEARAVRLPLDGALRAAFQAHDVNGPQRRLLGRARPAAAQQRRSLREVLRLEEQPSEGGVGQVVRCRGEHDLGVARDLDLAGSVAVVRDRQPPHLDVVLGRHGDVEERCDAVVATAERGLLREEGHQVVVRIRPGRVVGRGPHGPAAHVPEVDELASRVARGVVPVAGDDTTAAEAGAAARVRHDRGVAAVRQELRVRPQRVRRAEATQSLRGGGARRACLLHRAGLGDRRRARHALLQQQLRGLHARVGVEAPHHRVAEQDVGERDEGHALVVGHEGPHDGSVGRVAGLARAELGGGPVRVVDRLVVAVGPRAPVVRQAPQVAHRELRLHHRGEGRRVRSHDQLVGEAPFQAQAGHAEGLVLVVAAGDR